MAACLSIQDVYVPPTDHPLEGPRRRPNVLAGSTNGLYIACGNGNGEVMLFKRHPFGFNRAYDIQLLESGNLTVSDSGIVTSHCEHGTYRVDPNRRVLKINSRNNKQDELQFISQGDTKIEFNYRQRTLYVSCKGRSWKFIGEAGSLCNRAALSADGSRVGLGTGSKVWMFEAQTGRILASGEIGDGVWRLAFCGNHVLAESTRPGALGYITDEAKMK